MINSLGLDKPYYLSHAAGFAETHHHHSKQVGHLAEYTPGNFQKGFYTIVCSYVLFALLKISSVSKNSRCTQFVSHFKDYSPIHLSGFKKYFKIFFQNTKRRYLCRETDFIKTSSKYTCHNVSLKFQNIKIHKNNPRVFCHLSLKRDWKKYFSFLTKNKKEEIVH